MNNYYSYHYIRYNSQIGDQLSLKHRLALEEGVQGQPTRE